MGGGTKYHLLRKGECDWSHDWTHGTLALDSVVENGTHERDDGRLGLTAAVAALGVVLVAGIVMISFLLSRPGQNGSIEIHPPPSTPTQSPTASPSPLNVYVTGAVKVQGVVEVSPGARVQDAVSAAGGARGDADLIRCNLAALLYDGQHLHVPAVGEAVPAAVQDGQEGAAPEQIVNINSATIEELTLLPGVGDATAAKIVAHRHEHGLFSTIKEIMDVPGIGQSKFDGFKERITVGP